MVLGAGKKSSGKAVRDESMIDKKHELEKRLENVKGALGAPSKKPPKKGLNFRHLLLLDYRILTTAALQVLVYAMIVRSSPSVCYDSPFKS